MATAVFGLCASDLTGHHLVTTLLDESFLPETVSVLYPASHMTRPQMSASDTAAPIMPSAPDQVAAGMAPGGALARMPGLMQVAITGIGTLCVAGPFLAAAKSAMAASPARGLVDLLATLGIPESEVRRYEGKLRAGRFLVSVIAGDEDRADDAAELFAGAGAEDIVFSSDATPPAQRLSVMHRQRSAPFPRKRDIHSRP